MDTNSRYDALQVSVQRRLSKGLQMGLPTLTPIRLITGLTSTRMP